MQGLSHAVTSSDNSLESTVKVLVDEIRELKGQLGKRDDELKRLMEETRVLRAGLEEKDKELAEIKQKLAGEGIGGSNKNGNSGPKLAIETDDFKVKFGGQYRINSYTVDSGLEGDHPTASRVRIRQNLDFLFSKQFRTHLQFELGHTNDNIETTSSSSCHTDVSIRHAVMDYTFTNGIEAKAGIVPLSDKFGDMLFFI